MMEKLTKEQIQFIDGRLYNIGVEFIDIRYEMLDHIASELEGMEGDFGENWTEYFIMNRLELIKQNKTAKRNAMIRALKMYFRMLFTPIFFICAALLFTVVYFYARHYVEDFDLSLFSSYMLFALLIPFAFVSWKSKKISVMRAMAQIYTYIYLGNMFVPLTARMIVGRKGKIFWEQISVSLMVALMVILIISLYRCRKQYVGKYI